MKLHKSCKCGTFAVILSMFFCPLVASAAPGRLSSEFLNLGVSARAMAMGGAFSGLSDDISALHWNPGGLAQIKNLEMLGMYDLLFEGVHHVYFGIGNQLESGDVIAGYINYLGSGSMVEVDALGQKLGNTSANEICAGLSAATNIYGNFYAGTVLKIIYESLAEVNARSYAMDLGLLYTFPINLNLGLSIQNIGSGLKFIDDTLPLPMTTRLGAAYTVMDRPAGKVIICSDVATEPSDDSINMSFGTEYVYNSVVAVRLGVLSTSDETIPAYGVGFVFGNGISMDFAVMNYADFGSTYKVSVIEKFGLPKPKDGNITETNADIMIRQALQEKKYYKAAQINKTKQVEAEVEKAIKKEDYLRVDSLMQIIKLEQEIAAALEQENYQKAEELNNLIKKIKLDMEIQQLEKQ